jgi:hypothetical protein
MSNGIASGVPPADGGPGDAAGDGVGDCAQAKEPVKVLIKELISAMAQVARANETIERILFLPVEAFLGLPSLSVQ